jgi:Na+/melibiose symporter-like transporter
MLDNTEAVSPSAQISRMFCDNTSVLQFLCEINTILLKSLVFFCLLCYEFNIVLGIPLYYFVNTSPTLSFQPAYFVHLVSASISGANLVRLRLSNNAVCS